MANLNVNKTILGGRLTANPEQKQTQNGISVCSFSIAVTRKANKEETDFFNCTAWRATADFISRYFTRGSSIMVIGTIQNRTWTDSNGNKKYATDIVVDEAYFVDSKSEGTQATETTPQFANTTPNFKEIKASDDLPF